MPEDLFFYIKNAPAIIKDKEKRRVLENFLALVFLQGMNYLLPLIYVPYLLRVIGVEKYGIIAFAQSITLYISLIVDYGFSVSAARDISVERENVSKVSKIFSTVITIKSILTILMFFILLGAIFMFPTLKKDALVYIGAFCFVIGYTLYPTWLFQGLEKMKITTITSIIGKAFSTAAIFVVVRSQEDYIYPALVNSSGTILAGLISLFVLYTKFGIRYERPSLKDIKLWMKRGQNLFISTISSSIFRSSNPIIIKLITGNDTSVGLYATGDKIVSTAQSMINPMSQAIFPYASMKFSKLRFREALSKLKKMLYIPLLVTVPITASLFIFAPLLSKMALGYTSTELSLVLRILSFIIIIGTLNYFLGIIGFANLGKEKALMKCFLDATVVHLTTSYILSRFFGAKGASLALLISESTLLTTLLFRLKRLKYKKTEKSK